MEMSLNFMAFGPTNVGQLLGKVVGRKKINSFPPVTRINDYGDHAVIVKNMFNVVLDHENRPFIVQIAIENEKILSKK